MRKNEVLCDECGRATPKFHRIYKGKGYCESCYARVFKSRLCPCCKKPARLPINEPDARCHHCELAVPCARCGKSNYVIGRITPYGPVCNSCSVYFREERTCARCGRPSRLLSRVARLGIEEQICPACQRIDYGTCFKCHRYRLLFDDSEGHRICKKCIEGGTVTCTQCGGAMPSGHGLQCENCYWTALTIKRTATASEMFSIREHADVFRDFGKWLCNEVGAKKAAMTILRYLPFFIDVASLGTRTPPYQELLQHFSALGLRRNLLPMRFFEKTNRVIVNERQKQDASDQRRIDATLSKAPSAGHLRELLDQYYAALRLKLVAEKTCLRSIRLSLTPAAALISVAAEFGHTQPEQTDLSQYLSNTPGQRAAITGFVHFLRTEYGSSLEMPTKKSRGNTFAARRKLEWKIATQLQSDLRSHVACMTLLISALQYFHNVPAKRAKLIATTGVLTAAPDGNAFVLHADKKYRLPREISQPLMANSALLPPSE